MTSSSPDGAPATYCYAVFGGVLCAELPFPELRPIEGGSTTGATWVLRVSEAPPAHDAALVVVGERERGRERYRLSRTLGALRLEYSHGGCFDVALDGRTITWYRRDDVLLELVRSIILGPALALALEADGCLCVHGSAVAIDDRAVAFLGPKYYGKSTLAMALTAAGAQLLGDDLLALTPGQPTMVRPGVASVRLWTDSFDALAVEDVCDSIIRGVKTTAGGFPDEAVVRDALPLAAIYILDPESPDGEARVGWRTRLPPVAAAVALAQQAKLADTLVGLSAAGLRLRRASTVVATVPVWTLHAVRDLARLPRLVRLVEHWTRAGAAVPDLIAEEEYV